MVQTGLSEWLDTLALLPRYRFPKSLRARGVGHLFPGKVNSDVIFDKARLD